MVIKKIKLIELKEPEKNVRMHTEQQLHEFERSIKMFGQIRPIVVDENNIILAGCGLYETLLKMGKKEADCYKVEGLTENQKKKLMIADNKIFNLGVENLEVLQEFLTEMSGDLDIPGFDEDILQQMVADASEVTERVSDYGTLDDATINSIREKGSKTEQRIEETEKAPESPEKSLDGDEAENEPAELKKFVICPNCGEKIWL